MISLSPTTCSKARLASTLFCGAAAAQAQQVFRVTTIREEAAT